MHGNSGISMAQHKMTFFPQAPKSHPSWKFASSPWAHAWVVNSMSWESVTSCWFFAYPVLCSVWSNTFKIQSQGYSPSPCVYILVNSFSFFNQNLFPSFSGPACSQPSYVGDLILVISLVARSEDGMSSWGGYLLLHGEKSSAESSLLRLLTLPPERWATSSSSEISGGSTELRVTEALTQMTPFHGLGPRFSQRQPVREHIRPTLTVTI